MTIRKQTRRWETKDGRKIRICDMNDGHLVNTINLVRRWAAQECARVSFFYVMGPQPHGDMAQDCFDRECDQAATATWHDYVDGLRDGIYDSLLLDFERRELDFEQLKEPPDGQAMALNAMLKTLKKRGAKV